MEKTKITKDMLIKDIIEKCPEGAFVMLQAGMHCVGCHISAHETLEQGAKAHGLSEEDIDKLVKDINKELEKKIEQ